MEGRCIHFTMRHRLIRSIGREMLSATRLEKIVLILPFIVLLIDAEICYYSFVHKELTILVASSFVLVLSVLEIIAVLREIHARFMEVWKREEIEKRIEDIIKEFEDTPTVREVIERFCSTSPGEYSPSHLYHIVCDILEKSQSKSK